MVSAAKVDPLHLRQPCAELLLDGFERLRQRLRPLLAKRMKVQPRQPFHLVGAKIAALDAETRASRAWVIDRVLLRRMLGIDAQAARAAVLQGELAVLFPLGEGVEYDVIGNFDDLRHVRLLERRRKDVVLLSLHLLVCETCLKEAARRRTCEVFGNERIEVKHRKRLLCQKHMCARLLLQVAQHGEIPAQKLLHDDVGGRRHGMENFCVFLEFPESLAHQSTSSGVKLSCHGKPQRFSASMNGSGSNCSML